ncbi:MAG: AbrB/MazE/SpoVT family DNA-binding domain-containing protein [Promethearchaeota archaeon]
MGPKGQIVMPKDIRDFLNIQPGDEIIIEVMDNEVRLKPVENGDVFLSNFIQTPKKFGKKIDIERLLVKKYD